jgi:predicted anti-sigma-YlaC factor YlaD
MGSVNCSTCREALSARLDGEAEPVPAAETDAHLAGCADCTRWLDRAHVLTRSLRVRPAQPVPDLAAAVLAAAPPRRAPAVARSALAAVAVVQLLLALSQLFAGSASHAGHGGGHLFNEGAAWNFALGVGLLVAAVHAHRAAGLLPTLGGFVAVLAVFSARDLAEGTATVARVLSHLPLLAGLVLLYLVHRTHRDRPVPGSPAAEDHDDRSSTPADRSPRARRRRFPARRLKPTAHRRAA